MMLNLYTGRVCFERRYKRLNVPYLNTTVKCGDKRFAPSWQIVMDVKAQIISPEEYTEEYIRMMEESYLKHPEIWQEVMQASGELIVTCFCPVNKFCHRHLLVEFIIAKASQQSIEIVSKGEYPLDPPTFTEGK